MCGRYGISVTREELKDYLSEHYNISVLDENITVPRYNIAPGQSVISLINDGTKFRVGLLKWGFIPSWAKDEKIGYKMINARSETLKEKPAFKKSFYQRRCVIIADGFFEWYRTTSTKTPYYFYLKNNKIFGFAGLYTAFIREDGTKLYTCTIITTKANTLMKDIHERMPVILTEDSSKLWLDPSVKDSDVLEKILVEYDPSEMELHQVSRRVNKTENDDVDLIRRIIEKDK
jgi:putative SOS response-associated peptidase YedK